MGESLRGVTVFLGYVCMFRCHVSMAHPLVFIHVYNTYVNMYIYIYIDMYIYIYMYVCMRKFLKDGFYLFTRNQKVAFVHRIYIIWDNCYIRAFLTD